MLIFRKQLLKGAHDAGVEMTDPLTLGLDVTARRDIAGRERHRGRDAHC